MVVTFSAGTPPTMNFVGQPVLSSFAKSIGGTVVATAATFVQVYFFVLELYVHLKLVVPVLVDVPYCVFVHLSLFFTEGAEAPAVEVIANVEVSAKTVATTAFIDFFMMIFLLCNGCWV